MKYTDIDQNKPGNANSLSVDSFSGKATDVTLASNLNKIAKAYDSPTWWYDIRGFFILTFAYRSTLWEQISLFSRNMGENHLEGAIGTGTLFHMIMLWRTITRRPKVSITAFDYAEPMLDGARRRFAKWPHVKLLHADVGNLPLPDQSFDTINVANAVHCFPDIQIAARELYRVLKPAGTMAVNVLLYPKSNGFLDRISTRINNWGTKKGILYTPYQQAEITKILEAAGFKTTYTRRRGNVLNMILAK